MDIRHIMCVHAMLVRLKPYRTLEIGGHTGCSSSAFIAAGIPDAHFAEISPNDKFLSVVAGRGVVHQRKGCDVIREEDPFDVILVDGAHDLESVTEEMEALMAKPPRVIVAHDVTSTAIGLPYCEGAALFLGLEGNGWMTVTDCRQRDGERTERGLLMAYMDGDVEAERAILSAMIEYT